MAETFLNLSLDDRREVLEAARGRGLDRSPALLEKDAWVVWTLQALFAAPFGDGLVFKGGTSLSKAYGIIQRFSEDVDLTYDIRRLPDPRALQPDGLTAAEAKSLSRRIQEKLLPRFIAEAVEPFLASQLAAAGLTATLEREGENLFVAYETAVDYPDYVKPRVKLEFGARSTGEPAQIMAITCDLAAAFPELTFPAATPRVMRAERTVWEKATAIHVYCFQGRFAGAVGFARHWHDLIRLDDAGVAEAAIADRAVAKAVAEHKTLFFPAKADGVEIDYHAAIDGGLKLVPQGEAYSKLEADYRAMIEAAYLEDGAQTFEIMMERTQALQDRINAAARGSPTH